MAGRQSKKAKLDSAYEDDFNVIEIYNDEDEEIIPAGQPERNTEKIDRPNVLTCQADVHEAPAKLTFEQAVRNTELAKKVVMDSGNKAFIALQSQIDIANAMWMAEHSKKNKVR